VEECKCLNKDVITFGGEDNNKENTMLKNFIAGCFVVAFTCAAWGAETSPIAPNEAELWQKILDRNKPGSSITNFVFIEGVPNICLVESTTPQATALANILYFLSAQSNNAFCCFCASKEDSNYLDRLAHEVGWPTTNMLPKKAGYLLMEALEKHRDTMEAEESRVSEVLSVLESKYGDKLNEKMVIFSSGVVYSSVLGKYLKKITDMTGIGRKLENFASKRYYRLEVQIKENPDSSYIQSQLMLGHPILLQDAAKHFYTVTGYFMQNGLSILIVHDPLSTKQHFHRTGFGGYCMDDVLGGMKKPLTGDMHLYKLTSTGNNISTLTILKWNRDDDDIRNIITTELKRIKQ
jgi:hypothetical protein